MGFLKVVFRFIQEKLLSGQASMWIAVGVVIGVAAGAGSLILYNLIRVISGLMLTGLSGFTLPQPGVVGGSPHYVISISSRFFIAVSTTVGGLVAGLLVYLLSPGTEGLGIDAAINAFHNLAAKIKNRTPAVKLVASAVVIGSGGSAGRDGPVAMISGVFGSYLADRLGLNDHDRRIVMASAIGAGFGSIFMAPIGGAIMSTEILYKRDFEVEALVPAITASVVGYAIFGFQFHYRSLFTTAPSAFLFVDPKSIIAYALIGIAAGLCGRFYVAFFDLVRRGFALLARIPPYLKPPIGGLCVGLIGMFFPEVLGLGYGWVQLILNGSMSHLPHAGPLVLFFLFLFLLKILATSLTIGSGGAGGVFAPSLASGAFLGASLGLVVHSILPSVSVAEATIVTMIAFFGAVSKTPVSMLIMGTEMAGGLDMFLPLMLATGAAYLAGGTRRSIYGAQVLDRLHSPAHMFEYRDDILRRLKLTDMMRRDFHSVSADAPVGRTSAEVVSGRYAGAVTIDAGKTAREAVRLLPDDSKQKLIVVDPESAAVVGTLGFSEIADAYEDAFRKFKLDQMRRRPGRRDGTTSSRRSGRSRRYQ